GALAGFLQAVKADALICGGIGMGAKMALSDAGIRLYAGIQGSTDAAARAFADGTLEFDPDAKCDHHNHDGEGHECDHQNCEGHGCEHHQAD
ncbi:MAG: NifB/NifX family molybdenum-iron cluster-binding protein, partial [Lachnospiraceae bacterium]|nr:NifB/NifX family molybdenum-iron cluster-binding protein [Lachnospiraceae bacterium]